MIFTPVSIGGGGGCCKCSWFKPTIIPSGEENYVSINPGIIYRSFNLKDMMVYTGYIDDSTKGQIEAKEGNISGHVINGLMENIEIEEFDGIILKIGVGPNLYATGASIEKVSLDDDPIWSGYPEPFVWNPPFEFEDDGTPKNDVKYRRQTHCIIPVAYLTDDEFQEGQTVTFGSGENAKTQKLVRVLCDNLMMTSFNYDGTPVAFPMQATLHPFFWYKTGS